MNPKWPKSRLKWTSLPRSAFFAIAKRSLWSWRLSARAPRKIAIVNARNHTGTWRLTSLSFANVGSNLRTRRRRSSASPRPQAHFSTRTRASSPERGGHRFQTFANAGKGSWTRREISVPHYFLLRKRDTALTFAKKETRTSTPDFWNSTRNSLEPPGIPYKCTNKSTNIKQTCSNSQSA